MCTCVLCTVYSVQSTVYSSLLSTVQFTGYSLQSTVVCRSVVFSLQSTATVAVKHSCTHPAGSLHLTLASI